MKKSKIQNNRNYIENDQGLEIFTIPNFLTDEECDYLCDHIEKNNSRSMVAGKGIEKSVYNQGRTSSTSMLTDSDLTVQIVNNKMYTELGIDGSYSENTQGQIYQEGQHFNHHNDYFDNDAYINHGLSSGQRTWTFMVYLNDVEEGGETEFRNLDLKIKPIKGTAVVWKNSDGKGTENPASHHCGTHVTKGKKVVITKWFRENVYNAIEDERLATEYHKNTTQHTFSSASQLPKLTEKGFKIVKVPNQTWRLIEDAYKLLQSVKTVETWDGIANIIHDKDGNSPVEIFNMDHCFRIKEIIQEELKQIHEEFAGQPIEPVCIYGIRSYMNGAILENHIDRPQTHHVSSVVIIDKKLKDCSSCNDWSLDIQDHDGNWHKVYAEPGDMILYESAICKHGRPDPFKGEYYRNMFIHYKLSNYTYVGQ
jgi:prolyl 4-hydroxylase